MFQLAHCARLLPTSVCTVSSPQEKAGGVFPDKVRLGSAGCQVHLGLWTGHNRTQHSRGRHAAVRGTTPAGCWFELQVLSDPRAATNVFFFIWANLFLTLNQWCAAFSRPWHSFAVSYNIFTYRSFKAPVFLTFEGENLSTADLKIKLDLKCDAVAFNLIRLLRCKG